MAIGGLLQMGGRMIGPQVCPPALVPFLHSFGAVASFECS